MSPNLRPIWVCPSRRFYDWRARGKGPAAYRFGKHVKFAVLDVRAWVAEQRESAN